jgi:hypothetical protein
MKLKLKLTNSSFSFAFVSSFKKSKNSTFILLCGISQKSFKILPWIGGRDLLAFCLFSYCSAEPQRRAEINFFTAYEKPTPLSLDSNLRPLPFRRATVPLEAVEPRGQQRRPGDAVVCRGRQPEAGLHVEQDRLRRQGDRGKSSGEKIKRLYDTIVTDS